MYFVIQGLGYHDTVIQIEDVEFNEAGGLRILKVPEPGQNI